MLAFDSSTQNTPALTTNRSEKDESLAPHRVYFFFESEHRIIWLLLQCFTLRSCRSDLLILLLFFLLYDSLWYGNSDSFHQISVVLKEGLNTSAEQECVFVAFFGQHLCVLNTSSLVQHVSNDEFVLLVLESKQLGDGLIASNVGSWEVYRLLDVPVLILVRFAQVE